MTRPLDDESFWENEILNLRGFYLIPSVTFFYLEINYNFQAIKTRQYIIIYSSLQDFVYKFVDSLCLVSIVFRCFIFLSIDISKERKDEYV